MRLACHVIRAHWDQSPRLRAKACLPASSFLVFLFCPCLVPLPPLYPSLLSSSPVILVLGYIFLTGSERVWLVEEWRTEAEKGRQGTAERPLSMQTVDPGWLTRDHTDPSLLLVPCLQGNALPSFEHVPSLRSAVTKSTHSSHSGGWPIPGMWCP